MLTSIKEKATGWIAWAIVILITIPFALWGVNSYFTGLHDIYVAEVNGEEIEYQVYQQALYQERDRIRDRLGSNVSPEILSGAFLGRQVVEQIINEMLLTRDAESNRYRISDQQLASYIRSEPSFQTENQFDQLLYERILQFSGYSPAQFEGIQRASAAVQQVQTGYTYSWLDVDQAVDDVLSLALHQRYGDYAVIQPSQFLSEIEISEDEIKTRFEENSTVYQDPARMRIEFVELKLTDFAQNYTPKEEELQRIYDSQRSELLGDEQRSVSHILIEISEDSDNAEAEAETLANELAQRARSGEDFAVLAQEFSADAGSAGLGGSLGIINRGVTVAEFEAAVFSLELDEISDPVRTQFGFHVIRVDDIAAGELKTYDEAQDDLVEIAKRENAELEMFTVAEEVRNLSYEQPDSLDPLSDTLGLKVETSDWFTMDSGTGIAENYQVRTTAFGNEVLVEDFNSNLIELATDHLVVLRKYDYNEPAQLSLDEVKDEISVELLNERSSQIAEELGLEIVQILTSDSNSVWDTVIAERGLGKHTSTATRINH